METKTREFANVSVEWLMKNIGFSIDLGGSFELANLIEYKLSWSLYRDDADQLGSYYNRLVDTILADGFNKPICVYMPEVWDGSGDYYPVFGQGNGHHRLCLAILLGLDYIPVCFSFTDDYMHCDVTGE